MKSIKLVIIVTSLGGLSSCMMGSSGDFSSYEPYNYAEAPYFSESYYMGSYGGLREHYGKTVTVPDSYYAGASRSPSKHKDMDKSWVNNQNPQGYTIEIAEGDKASEVAGKLFKAPKKDRTAQIKSRRMGGTYYKGVYGSYNSYEEAQKALNDLPDDVKKGAGIKQWGKVQSNMSDY